MHDDSSMSNATGLPALAVHRAARTTTDAERAIASSGSTGLQSGFRHPSMPHPSTPHPSTPHAAPARRPRPLRVGDTVRSLVDDVCVTVGLTGLVVNVIHPGYGGNQGRTPRARVLWDNDTSSMAEYDTFTVITGLGAGSDVA